MTEVQAEETQFYIINGYEKVSAFEYDWYIKRLRSGCWVGVCQQLKIALQGNSRSDFLNVPKKQFN